MSLSYKKINQVFSVITFLLFVCKLLLLSWSRSGWTLDLMTRCGIPEKINPSPSNDEDLLSECPTMDGHSELQQLKRFWKLSLGEKIDNYLKMETMATKLKKRYANYTIGQYNFTIILNIKYLHNNDVYHSSMMSFCFISGF